MGIRNLGFWGSIFIFWEVGVCVFLYPNSSGVVLGFLRWSCYWFIWWWIRLFLFVGLLGILIKVVSFGEGHGKKLHCESISWRVNLRPSGGTVFVEGLIVFQIQSALDLFFHLVLFSNCCSLLRIRVMACVKLGSKADAFQRQGQAWYLALSFCLLCKLQFCFLCSLSPLSSNVTVFSVLWGLRWGRTFFLLVSLLVSSRVYIGSEY